MKRIYLFSLLLLCSFISFFGITASLSEKQSPQIVVEHAYVRASIPGTSHSSSYMEIENIRETKLTLLSVSSNISPRIEIHQHTMIDGMMRMRKLNSLEVKAKARVKLQPSGLHLMIFDVKKPLVSKQNVELTLNFSNNVSVTVKAPIYSPSQERLAHKSVSKVHEHHH